MGGRYGHFLIRFERREFTYATVPPPKNNSPAGKAHWNGGSDGCGSAGVGVEVPGSPGVAVGACTIGPVEGASAGVSVGVGRASVGVTLDGSRAGVALGPALRVGVAGAGPGGAAVTVGGTDVPRICATKSMTTCTLEGL